jgi:hypothetical protein
MDSRTTALGLTFPRALLSITDETMAPSVGAAVSATALPPSDVGVTNKRHSPHAATITRKLGQRLASTWCTLRSAKQSRGFTLSDS